jgi:hypothetical protein
MSYWVYLSVDAGGTVEFEIYDWNYTSNCAQMWRHAGVDLKDFDGKLASECEEPLRLAVEHMVRHQDEYIPMNPDNGWGDYKSLIEALNNLYFAMVNAPNAKVRVSC